MISIRETHKNDKRAGTIQNHRTTETKKHIGTGVRPKKLKHIRWYIKNMSNI